MSRQRPDIYRLIFAIAHLELVYFCITGVALRFIVLRIPEFCVRKTKTRRKMETDSIALSSSSCAPTEFQVLSSYDSRTTTISVAVEHCQLCGGSRRPFYCRDCIRAGDFQHSGAGGDRYSANNACWGPSEANRLQRYAYR